MRRGVTVFHGEKSGQKTLVLLNYKWYRDYYWHVPQLDPRLAHGPVCVINFVDLGVGLSWLRRRLLWFRTLYAQCKSASTIIIDGFIGVAPYMLILLGVFRGKKVILATQNYTAPNLTFRSIIKFAFLRAVYSKSDGVLFCSASSRRLYASFFNSDALNQRFVVLHSPLNFEPVAEYLPPSEVIGHYIASAGQANRDYATLSEASCSFEWPLIVDCPTALYDSARFAQSVSHRTSDKTSDLLDFLRNSRLVIIPLCDVIEMSGLRVLYFSLELGKPIIVSETESLRELFGDTPPFWFTPTEDGQALAELVGRVAGDTELLARYGKMARTWAENNLLSSDHINAIWRRFDL